MVLAAGIYEVLLFPFSVVLLVTTSEATRVTVKPSLQKEYMIRRFNRTERTELRLIRLMSHKTFRRNKSTEDKITRSKTKKENLDYKAFEVC